MLTRRTRILADRRKGSIVRLPGWQKPIRGTQLNHSHPLARGLVAYWIFNENSGPGVEGLSSTIGTLKGTPTWQGGGFDFAAAADGLNTNISSILQGDAGFFPVDITIVWRMLNRNTDSANHWIFSKGTQLEGGQGFHIRRYGTNLYAHAKNSGSFLFTTGNPVTDGQDAHWAIRLGSASAQDDIFLNGQKVAVTRDAGERGEIRNSNAIQLGEDDLGDFPGGWEGRLYYMYIYEGRYLVDAEIAYIHREPYGMFL